MGLDAYHRKRNFGTTPEPKGRVHAKKTRGLRYVIQKHRASHLHYDFRLELDGVLLSWAVPKGPSLDPADKRLAMHVEDHPLEYGDFEGIIPPGQYGSGTVLLWDRGTWLPREDAVAGYRKGRLKFELDGEKLHGGWTLVKSRSGKYGNDNSWLLIKEQDAFAQPAAQGRVVDERPLSVVSGRTLEDIAADPEREWHSNRSVAENVAAGKVRRSKPALALARLAGARKAPDPEWVPPVLATLVSEAPGGGDWLHEIKYDGYRMLCHVAGGRCTILSRSGRDWTDALPMVAAAAARLPLEEGWLDGEVIAVDAQGRSSFQALQNAFAGEGAEHLVYYAFDLPYANGYDLRDAPLHVRKDVLRKIIPAAPGMIRFSDHVQGDGAAFFAEACKVGLEGIVSKRRDSPYRAGRGRDWVKVKCVQRQEMVIGGWTDPQGSRTGFGALLIGYYDADGDLHYAGKVGTGFTDESLATVAQALQQLATDRPAFVDPPTGAEGRRAHWVKPALVAEVSFTEWTRDGTLRHPSFQGLRRDKPAREVVREVAQPAADADGASAASAAQPQRAEARQREKPPKATKAAKATKATKASKAAKATKATRTTKAATRTTHAATPGRAGTGDETEQVAGVTITHPGKLLYPEAGITKGELARYYAAIGERMVPHLAGRPLTLVRCPNGWKAHCFYQKHAKPPVGAFLETIEVRESTGPATYLMANSVGAIVSLLQMGALEVHPWGSRQGALDRPDRIIMDFDPDDALPWQALVDAVTVLRKLLDTLGLQGFLKTTGGKGLHVVLPIAPTLRWDTVLAFCKAIAELMVNTFPQRFTSKVTKRTRTGRILVDYLRNAEGATAVAAYSLRARQGAPVSMPIGWDELGEDVRFDHFNVRTALARLQRRRKDPWARFFEIEQAITPAMLQQLGVAPA